MAQAGKNLLITGLPGVGKTTLIKKLCDHLAHLKPIGFYTAEIREGGIRKGFQLVDLAGGSRFILSHVDIRSRFRVGKYGVDIAGLEKYLAGYDLRGLSGQLVVIDEIGKMECLSEKFVTFIQTLLTSDNNIMASIALKGGGIIREIRQRQDIHLLELNVQNRNTIQPEIIRYIA